MLFPKLVSLIAVLIVGEAAAIVQAANLYVTYPYSNTVHEFGITGTDTFGYTGTDLGTFASTGLNGPAGLAFDSSGNLYVANSEEDTIHKFSPSGADLGTFASVAGMYPQGLAFDSNGNLYVAVFGDNTVHEFDSTGGDLGIFASGLVGPTGLAFDDSGNLYVTNWGDNTLHEFGPTGADLGTFASGLVNPGGLAFDSSGNLYVANYNSVHKFGPTGTDLGTFASAGLNEATGLAFDSNGNLYVGNLLAEIHKFSPTGADLGVLPSGLDSSGFLAFAPVPEPSSLVLAIVGFAAVALGAQRRATRARHLVFKSRANLRSAAATLCLIVSATVSLGLADCRPVRAAAVVDLGNFKANAINDFGQIAGTVPAPDTYYPYTQAAIWEAGSVIPLTFGSMYDDVPLIGVATAINNLGGVVGYFDFESLFYWRNGTVDLFLDEIDNQMHPGAPAAVNDAGEFVGFSYNYGNFTFAIGTATHLPDPHDIISMSHAINNSGQVAGWAYGSIGHQAAV